MKYISHTILTFLLLLNYSYLYSSEKNKKYFSTLSPIHFSTTLSLGYQSLIYTHNNESASENFMTLSFLGSYFPLSFLGFTIDTGFGFAPTYMTSHLLETDKIYFPKDLSRFLFFIDLQSEFLLYTNPDNFIYTIIGFSYTYNSRAKSAKDILYTNSQQELYALKIGFGDRFAIFHHTILDINLTLKFPFHQTSSWINQGSKKYNQFIIGFEVGFGYFG